MKIFNILYFAVLVLLISCSTPKSESNDQTQETVKDISELTYQDVIKLVFDDEGEGVEWHGEESPNNFKDHINFSTEGTCGDGECGDAMFITNTHDSLSLLIVVKAAYNLDGDVGYIARKYELDKQQKLNIGCSDLCHNGKSYPFERSVVASSQIE